MKNQSLPNPLFPPNSWSDIFLITLFWGLAILLVNPSGDFPLNDDWSYGIAVKRILDTGTYNPTVWTSMSLISQVLWGGLFSMLFGFSFEVLRISTLVLSLFGLLSIYLIVRQLDQARWLAVFVSLTIAFNPIYFSLSNTFMTDIPFIAFSAMALLFFIRSIRKESKMDFLLGACLSTIAILCRQSALFIPLAYGLTVLYQKGFRPRALLQAIFPLALGFAALKGFQYWLNVTERVPELYGLQIQQLLDLIQQPAQWPVPLGKNSYVALMYMGLFLIPVLALLLSGKAEDKNVIQIRRWLKRIIIPFSVLMVTIVMLTDKLMPLTGNVLTSGGIGPLTLHDVYTLKLANAPAFSGAFWWIITIISVLGAAALVVYLSFIIVEIISGIRHQQKSSRQVFTLFFLSGAGIYFLPILFLGFYDRYLLMMMILLSMAFLSYSNKIKAPGPRLSLLGAGLLTLLALFSVTITHDYFSWNRARWTAIRSIVDEEKVPGFKVNGGFEFNGWYLFSKNSLEGGASEEWWAEEDDAFIITFGEVPGYKMVRSFEYNSWLPPNNGKICILKRESEQAGLKQD